MRVSDEHTLFHPLQPVTTNLIPGSYHPVAVLAFGCGSFLTPMQSFVTRFVHVYHPFIAHVNKALLGTIHLGSASSIDVPNISYGVERQVVCAAEDLVCWRGHPRKAYDCGPQRSDSGAQDERDDGEECSRVNREMAVAQHDDEAVQPIIGPRRSSRKGKGKSK